MKSIHLLQTRVTILPLFEMIKKVLIKKNVGNTQKQLQHVEQTHMTA